MLVIKGYKDNKDFILGNNDDLLQRIDDYIVVMENVLTSPYAKLIGPRAEK